MKETGRHLVTRIDAGKTEEIRESLVTEHEISVVLAGKTLVRATCSPSFLKELVYGYLVSEGFIRSHRDVSSFTVEGNVVEVRLGNKPSPQQSITPRPIESPFTLSADVLLAAAEECLSRGNTFRETGGTHAAALGDRTGLVSFFEDISRNCALEKVLGDALLRAVTPDETFVFLSSRVPKRMLLKIARCGIPVVVAVSAPTLEAVKTADRLRVCVCGFARGHRLNVYSHRWRVGLQ
jgi:FdhD protein